MLMQKRLKGLEDKLQNAMNENLKSTESKKTADTEVDSLKKDKKALQNQLEQKDKALNQMLTTQHGVDSKLEGKQEERNQKNRSRDSKAAKIGGHMDSSGRFSLVNGGGRCKDDSDDEDSHKARKKKKNKKKNKKDKKKRGKKRVSCL